MTTATSDLLLPGYRVDPETGAWVTLPWPDDPDERMAIVRMSLAPAIIDWAEWRTDEPGLTHYQTGEPWRFTPGQKRFMMLWWQLDETGRLVYRRGIKRGAKGPIAHDVPVATPDGWVRHGDLRVGSQVYAADGSVTEVTALREEVLEGCWTVRFADGASVVCTGSHRWPVDVFTGSAKRARRVMTVDEMLREGLVYERPLTNGRTKATKGGVSRFRALPSPVIEGRRAEFLIDPYVVGYWLGDGDSDCARITADVEDMAELIAEMNRLGIEHAEPSFTHGRTQRCRFGRGIAQAWFREIGILGNKHIPMWMLRASMDQRWSLLQGIVDSDGTVAASGQVEVSLSDERIAADVAELATSLGLMPRVTSGPTRSGATRWRIKFTPQAGEPAARLARKRSRLKSSGRQLPFSRSRTIVGIEPHESVPARCLTVEHESHVYLVGKANVPTCNTGKDPFAGALADCELLAPVELYDWDDKTGRPVGRRRGMPLVQITSNSEAQSKDLLRVANALIGKEAREFYRVDPGDTRTVLKDTFGRIEVNTFSESSSEGDPVTAGFINEPHHMTTSEGHKAAAVARRNAAKSPEHIQARVLETTNAHIQGAESVAEKSMQAWQNQLRPNFKGRRDILYDSIEAPPDADVMTRQGRLQALRAAYTDAPWGDLERLADEMTDDDLSVGDMIRYYLNGLATAEDAWVDSGRFDMLAEQKVIDRIDPVALFLDCSKSEDATGLVACRLSDKHVWVVDCWQKPKGWSEKRDGKWRVPREQVDAKVRETVMNHRVVWFGVDPSPTLDDDNSEALYWADLIEKWHRDFRQRIPVWATPGAQGHSILFDMRLSQRGGSQRMEEFTRAADRVRTWIDDDEEPEFSHDGDPRLRTHVHNAKRRPNQWGISLGKVTRDSTNLVDLAVCMVGAVMGASIALKSGKVRLPNPDRNSTGRASGGRGAGRRTAGRR